MDHQMGEWLYYNFAVGSFHTTKLLFIRFKLNLIFKKFKKSLFEPSFRGLRGKVHTQS